VALLAKALLTLWRLPDTAVKLLLTAFTVVFVIFSVLDTKLKLAETAPTEAPVAVPPKEANALFKALDTELKLPDTKLKLPDTKLKLPDTLVKLLLTAVKLLETVLKLLLTAVRTTFEVFKALDTDIKLPDTAVNSVHVGTAVPASSAVPSHFFNASCFNPKAVFKHSVVTIVGIY
jgi:hypothetical protein